MNLGYLDTFLDLNELIPEMYILDSIPDLWQFLNCENNGTWELVNNNYSQDSNIFEITDIMAFKHKILIIK